MAIRRLIIKHDGSHFVACLSNPFGMNTSGKKKKTETDPTYEQFKIFYHEAKEKKITKKGILEYVTDRFCEICDDFFEVPDIDTLEEYEKRYVTALHKRIRRYHEKAYLNDWNYFVTFTYSDAKMTASEFERQITTKLSDLSSHADWRYMMRWEEGEIGERKHLHAFLYVPEGKMVGELYKDHHYSTKRRKQEYFTNNTYFNERFGMSEWKELSNLKNHKKLINYLVKYMSKDGGKLIYSRGIPSVIDAEIDIDKEILATYERNECTYAVLNSFLFSIPQLKAAAVRQAFDLSELFGSELSPLPI